MTNLPLKTILLNEPHDHLLVGFEKKNKTKQNKTKKKQNKTKQIRFLTKIQHKQTH